MSKKCWIWLTSGSAAIHIEGNDILADLLSEDVLIECDALGSLGVTQELFRILCDLGQQGDEAPEDEDGEE